MTEAERAAVAEALPGYEITGELGRGSFGVVWAGTHARLRREVAVKQLPAQLAADPDVRARFDAEARVLAGLSHPHVVGVYDYVEHGGLCLLIMERLSGGTVLERFANGIDMATASAVVMAACAGLQSAHDHGVLHRDVKPENLLFDASGVLKVTDFGIAKVVNGTQTMATNSGAFMGTPAYMAPEQVAGDELGPPADVYATGVVLYELLSGQLPFSEEGGALFSAYRHLYEQPIPLAEVAPEVPAPLTAATMRAIARDQVDRFGTCQELGVALGSAATAAFGPGWLERTGIRLLDAGPILDSTRGTGQYPTDPGGMGSPPPPPPPPPGVPAGALPGAPRFDERADTRATSHRVRSRVTAPDPNGNPAQAAALLAAPVGIPAPPPPPAAPRPAPAPKAGRGKLLAIIGAVVVVILVAVVAVVALGGKGSKKKPHTAATTVPHHVTTTTKPKPKVVGVVPNIVAQVAVPGATGSIVATSTQHFWLATTVNGAGRLVSVKPDGTIRGEVALDGPPGVLGQDSGKVWFTNPAQHTIGWVDDVTGQIRQGMSVPGLPATMTMAHGAIWVDDSTNGQILYIPFDANGNLLTPKVGAKVAGTAEVSTGFGQAWVADPAGNLIRVDIHNAADPNKVLHVGGHPQHITAAFERLWITDPSNDRVIVVDESTMKIKAIVKLPGRPEAIATDLQKVWVLLPGKAVLLSPAAKIAGGATFGKGLNGVVAWEAGLVGVVDATGHRLFSMATPFAPVPAIKPTVKPGG